MSIRVYRLLRNNIEEGPYTAEELIQKNLRQFDLIWVDGSGAAWRYPGEISQFKKYAPLPEKTEESPQSGRATLAVSPSVQAAITVNNSLAASGIKEKPRYKISAAWTRIQTLTSSAANNTTVESEKKNAVKKSMVVSQAKDLPSKSLSWEEARLDWEKEKKSENDFLQPVQPKKSKSKKNVQVVKSDAPVLETKYSESLDSLEDKYIENVLRQHKSKTNASGKTAGFVLPTLALIIIFSSAYWLLNSADAPSIKKSQQTITNASPATTPVNNEKENTATKVSVSEKQIASLNNNEVDARIAERKEVSAPVSKSVTAANNNTEEKPSAKTVTASVVPPSIKQDTQKIIDNIDVVQKAINNIKSNTKAEMPKQVSTNEKQVVDNAINSDTYKNPTFLPASTPEDNEPETTKEIKKLTADYVKVPETIKMADGIANIKIENVSDVNLDLVVLDVQYFNSSNNFRKGETFYLHNLKAGRNVVLKTPKDIGSDHATSKVSLISSDTKQVYVVGDN